MQPAVEVLTAVGQELLVDLESAETVEVRTTQGQMVQPILVREVVALTSSQGETEDQV
jgi:hypothetical protein